MAKPAKRRIEGTTTASGDSASSSSSPGNDVTKAPKATSKRVTPKGDGRPSGRYTPPGTRSASKGPSPRWVPVLMFGLWTVGLLVIILNYMGVLPGSADGGNGWYLVGGLTAILAGIMVATQYR